MSYPQILRDEEGFPIPQWYDGEEFQPLEGLTNERNGKKAILVDTQSIESTITKEYTTNIDEVILSPSDGNRLIVHDVFLMADGNIGPVDLDWENNGDPISRLYTSQFNRASFTNITIQGEKDKGINLKADAQGNKLFLAINYVEVEADED